MRLQGLGLALLVGLALIFGRSARAATPGQVDTFDDGSTLGWTNGAGGFGIVNVNHDGPAGATDHFLQVSSGAFGGRPNLITFNDTQWLGNFNGVAGIRVDLKNLDPGIANPDMGQPAAVPIRFAIREGTGPSVTPGYASGSFIVPADPNWHQSVFFPFTTLTMTALNGAHPLATDMANVRDFRLLSSVQPALVGDGISASIGIDNITAVPKGDWNQDGSTTPADIQAMLNALTDLNAYQLQKNLDNIGLLALGDFNFDGKVDNLDIQPLLDLVEAQGQGSIAAVPEPATWMPASCAFAALAWTIYRRL